MPGSTPRTLIEVDSEKLPYACQCPLCGGLFDIPEGLLYKIEEDALVDGDFTDDDLDAESTPENFGSESESSTMPEETSSESLEVGGMDDTAI